MADCPKKSTRSTPFFTRLWIMAMVAVVIAALFVFGANLGVTAAAGSRILTREEAASLPTFDCILVLGAGVENDRPSHMLEDRLLEGIALYKAGASDRLLMSGDHGQEDYDEVNVMKAFAVERNVPSEAVFMDHAGFCTYDSLYRARDVFQAHRVLIVTQEYHLYRALYIAQQLGLDAYGVPSDPRAYSGQSARELREIAARTKDVLTCAVHASPTYLGEAVPVSGNGNVTNDK